jgi:hypothetical protein
VPLPDTLKIVEALECGKYRVDRHEFSALELSKRRIVRYGPGVRRPRGKKRTFLRKSDSRIVQDAIRVGPDPVFASVPTQFIWIDGTVW